MGSVWTGAGTYASGAYSYAAGGVKKAGEAIEGAKIGVKAAAAGKYVYDGAGKTTTYVGDGAVKGYEYTKDGVGKGITYVGDGISKVAQTETVKGASAAVSNASKAVWGAIGSMLSSKKPDVAEEEKSEEGEAMKEVPKE